MSLKSVFRREKSRVRLSRSFGGTFAIFLFLLIVGTFMALPIVYSLVQSVKPMEEIFAYPPKFFVKHPTFDNYIQVYQLCQNLWVPLSRYVFNSLFISIVGTVAYVLIASMAAFPLSKHRFPGKVIISGIIVWALLFRPEVTGVAQYIIISKLGMINTYWSMLLPPMAGTFGVFLMMQFMESAIPDSVLEAARIDGANEYRIFYGIAMPAVKPAWLTLVIFTFQTFWNTTGVSYIYSESLKTLPTVLGNISSGGLARAGASSAVAVILLIPPIVIFIISQSSMTETMAHTGLK
ncbi:MAG: carbohydrate ABC transporter permease [Clostridia bacterium]|nr:carbohydrate ABC transporter permease [Clostridia bacterium]